MLLKASARSPVLLIRPGSTDFDEQGRIKGSLDMPMSENGHQQVELICDEISDFRPSILYSAPCESAIQTAETLASRSGSKIKIIDAFRNVDHGLWHGKLLDELRRNHPKLYKRGQETPEEICPPGGESLFDAKLRIEKAVNKVIKKSGSQLVAFVIPDPLAQIVHHLLSGQQWSKLWDAETDRADWQLIEPVSE
ncbi:Phosphoserine phosphatase 1 [Rubripirellula obstinata]|uniref:Phosphoserine phosphatase 1 n=1 Tax=Rubripirellula obstinata TaxID=406547 RepID=A0A5B1CN54_9BACT|nr:histidine phosphatase family protein [Rubripirellula obstinata]KAA1261792.1 Phosphoserine phosphatase 1 [Rubripirellula obstinata]